MKKLLIVLILLLCLAACGGREDSQPEQGLFWEASGIPEEEVLLTVDGREVPAWRYCFWLSRACDSLRAQYDEAGLALDWTAPLPGGTLGDYVKDQALADTALYATVENWATAYACADDRAAAQADWETQAARHGGEAAYLDLLASQGLDRGRAEELSGVGRLYRQLCGLYNTPGSPLAPTTEELEEFARRQGTITLDRILVAAGEDREAARQRAAVLFSQLNSAQDQAAAFSDLARAGDDPAGPRTLTPGEGTALDPALETAAAALEPGQVSGILESGEGFSILRRLPGDPAAVRADYLDHRLEDAAKRSAVQLTEAYGDLDPAAFADRLVRARQAVPGSR